MMRLMTLPVAAIEGPIAPIVHMIWVGGPRPAWVEAAMAQMDQLAAVDGLELRVWTEKTIEDTPLQAVYEFCERHEMEPRGYADILRLAAVGLYGGIYCDVDIVPLVSLKPLVGDRRGWVCSTEASAHQPKVLTNGVFGAPAGSSFIATVFARAELQVLRGVTNVHNVAGPQAFREVWNHSPESMDVEYRLTMKASQRERLQRLEGPEIDLETARELRPGAWFAHIGLPLEKRSVA